MKSNFTRQNIITLPNPHLRENSAKIHHIDDQLKQLIADMTAATVDWENSRPHEVAVALAAIQIDQPYRVIIVREDFDNKENQKFTVLINPEVIKAYGDLTYEQEGCLSVKDIYGTVPRYSKLRLKALDEEGHEIRVKTANPFLARVLQHEIDHTNGICFVDHIANKKDAWFLLDDAGDLVPISYDEVKSRGILPSDGENRVK
jgi:peptide deformylase